MLLSVKPLLRRGRHHRAAYNGNALSLWPSKRNSLTFDQDLYAQETIMTIKMVPGIMSIIIPTMAGVKPQSKENAPQYAEVKEKMRCIPCE